MFSEIKNDYMTGPLFEGGQGANKEGILGCVTIDGWKTDDANEQGEVIAAVLLTQHGDIAVDWHDNGARLNESVLTAITEAKSRLRGEFLSWLEEQRMGRNLSDAVQNARSLLSDNGVEPAKTKEVLQKLMQMFTGTELHTDGIPLYSCQEVLDAIKAAI